MCNHCDNIPSIPSNGIEGLENGISSDLYNIIVEIFSGRVKSAIKIVSDMTFGVLSGATASSFTTIEGLSLVKEYKSALNKNLQQFSIAKSEEYISELVKITNKSASFSQFLDNVKLLDKAADLHVKYNLNWLNTEFEQAKSNVIAGAEWKKIEAEKEIFPYLVYRTRNDGRVRQKHKELDGVIKRVDDPFWNIYYPPNGWHCRCYVEQLVEQPTDYVEPTPPPSLKDVNPLFRMNTGKDSLVFSKDHPYFVKPSNT